METQRKMLASLDAQRKALEAESEGIVSELTAEQPDGVPPMGVDTPLVDAEGYPRADIDVYRARTLRGRLAVIRTDHKNIMKRIEQGLNQMAMLRNPRKESEEQAELAARIAPKPKPKYDPVTGKWVVMSWDGSVAGVKGGDKRSFHNLQGGSSTNTGSASASAARVPTEAMQGMQITEGDGHPLGSDAGMEQVELVPFATVKSVAGGSPASEAGMKEGDLILSFGSVDHTNHRDLQAIGALVPMAAGAGESIRIVVQRQQTDRNTSLMLQPRPWSGRGLLGCHIVRYTAS